MTMPGFTAENSIRNTPAPYPLAATQRLGRRQQDNQVFLQVDNHPAESNFGGKCHFTATDGTILNGKYDIDGNCCAAGWEYDGVVWAMTCTRCDVIPYCGDGHLPIGFGESPLFPWDDSQQVFDGSIVNSPRPRWGIPRWSLPPRVRF